MIDKSNWGYEQGSPSNTVEEAKELSAEEHFYSLENPTKEDYEVIIEHFAGKLKSKNDELKSLVDMMENGHLDFYKNQLKAIIKI